MGANMAEGYRAWFVGICAIVALGHEAPAQNITITAPARAVASAPDVATTRIYREERGNTFYIPFIQTQPTLVVTATVQVASLPSGGGVKFVMDESTTNQIIQYDLSTPFTATFTNLAKAEHTLDTYIVDSSNSTVSGSANHDRATHIGIGDIILAIGDSVTAGWDGVVYSNAPYTDWTSVPQKSADNRNFPQVDIYNWITLANDVQMVSHHILENDILTRFDGYPVFILNEGVSTIWTGGYLPRMDQQAWQDRINALHPNKCQIHLGINEAQREKSEYTSNMTQIVSDLVTRHGIAASNIVLAVPAKWFETIWKPTIDSLISNLGLSRGPDFQGYYSRNTNPPVLYTTYHPTITGQCQMARLWALSWIYPKNVSAVPTANGISVTWSSLTTAEPSIAGYIVRVGTTPGVYSSTVDVGNVTQHLVAGLTSGQVYYVSVSAYDNDAYVPNETKSSGDLQVLNQSGGLQTFSCYNDMSWTTGQLTGNITTNSPLTLSSGTLKDYASGYVLPIQVSISIPGVTPGDGSGTACSPTPGTDAYNVFSNKVSCDGFTYWASGLGPATIQFTGLPTNKLYTFALYMNRGLELEKYSNRWADVVISDVLSFTNSSSLDTTISSSSLPNDSTRCVMANGTAGRLVRFDGINAGSDGTMTFTITPGGTALGQGTNVYLNAFMLATTGTNAPTQSAQTNQPPTNSNWTSYDDCAWTDNNTFGTNADVAAIGFTTNGPLNTSSTLINTNGTATGIQVSFVTNTATSVVFLDRPFQFPSGTPAEQVFAGHIGTNNAINWTKGTITMTLSGLSTSKQYSVALWSSRGSTTASYSNRWTDITIKSVDSFANDSSVGLTKLTTSMANDGTRVVAVLEGGKLAQYDQVRPGTDGTIVFDLTANGLGSGDTNGYLNAFMISSSDVIPGATGDADADGMPDSWEQSNFGGSAVANAGAYQDFDNDGVLNLDEFIAGSNPTSASSGPMLDHPVLTNGLMKFDFSTATGRVYTIDFRSNLVSSSWQTYTSFTGSGSAMSITNTRLDPRFYYRFRVRMEHP